MKTIFVGALAFCLVACNVTAKMDPGPPEAFSVPDLIGSWKSNCAASPSGGTWEVQTLDLTDTSFVWGASLYADHSCSQVIGSPVQFMNATYKITGEDNFLVNGIDLTLNFTDMSGAAKTGYQVAVLDAGLLYLGAYIGLDVHSRPADVDHIFAFRRTGTVQPHP